MQARSRRRVRSLRATVRSHARNHRHLHAFHYRKQGCRVTVLSHFVGGAPLICAPRHRDVREWVTTSVTFPFSLAPSHHVSRANSKISTLTQRILSATDNMEAARNCLCTFFCLWNWHFTQFDLFSKGVAPTSFTGQHHRHQDIETYLQETASSPTVPYHPVRRGNQAATQQMPVLRDETETLAMSE